MSTAEIVIAAGTITAGLGLWLLLPRGEQGGRRLGVLFALSSLGLFASLLPRLGSHTADAAFWILAGITVIAATCAVTLRNPVYCAIWFAMTLLGTAGLFLLQGAQFLGVATIVVYAGAILVTFLFVLMLAQPQGHAFYDRLSWEALISASVGAVMIGLLTMVITEAFNSPTLASAGKEPPPAAAAQDAAAQDGAKKAAAKKTPAASSTASAPAIEDRFTRADRQENILSPEHMDHLGAELFSRHLIAVEVAGTMLLAALVGAVAIVLQSKTLPSPSGGARHG